MVVTYSEELMIKNTLKCKKFCYYLTIQNVKYIHVQFNFYSILYKCF